jgi:hypothetical protein
MTRLVKIITGDVVRRHFETVGRVRVDCVV